MNFEELLPREQATQELMLHGIRMAIKLSAPEETEERKEKLAASILATTNKALTETPSLYFSASSFKGPNGSDMIIGVGRTGHVSGFLDKKGFRSWAHAYVSTVMVEGEELN